MANILISGATSATGIASIRWIYENWPDPNIILLGRQSDRLNALTQRFGLAAKAIDLDARPDDFVAHTTALDLPEIDILLHLAAESPSTAITPEQFYRVNFINSAALSKSIPFSKNATIVNFSTASVYDQNTEYLSEHSDKTTTNHYGISKLLFEKFLTKFSSQETNPPRVLSLRIPVLLAPDVKHNFLSKWKTEIIHGSEVVMANADAGFNACILLDDILNFCKHFHGQTAIHHLTCNVGSKAPVTIRHVHEILCKQMNRTASTTVVTSQKSSQFYDCSLAVKHGFEPSSVASAIKKFAEF